MLPLSHVLKGINRYIMECKFSSNSRRTSGGTFELIDTLWNVNETEGYA